jgi:hypothetical protein
VDVRDTHPAFNLEIDTLRVSALKKSLIAELASSSNKFWDGFMSAQPFLFESKVLATSRSSQ